jgi:hypothetical protein
MSRVKTFDSTGIAPNGRLYAGDINAIQDHYADLSNFSQTVDVGALRVGDTTLQLLKYGTAEFRLTGALRTDGTIRATGGGDIRATNYLIALDGLSTQAYLGLWAGMSTVVMQDAAIYRTAANTLTTSGAFNVSGNLIANSGQTYQIYFSNSGPGSATSIHLGSANDSYLYRHSTIGIGVHPRLVAPGVVDANVAGAGILVGSSWQGWLGQHWELNYNLGLGHNVYAHTDGSLKWFTTHATFGSRLLTLDYGLGFRFFADTAAATAGSTANPPERFRIQNDGNVRFFGQYIFFGSDNAVSLTRGGLSANDLTSLSRFVSPGIKLSGGGALLEFADGTSLSSAPSGISPGSIVTTALPVTAVQGSSPNFARADHQHAVGITDSHIVGTLSPAKLTPGSNGLFLTISGGVPTWGAAPTAPAPGSIISSPIGSTPTDGSAGTWARSDHQHRIGSMSNDGTALLWAGQLDIQVGGARRTLYSNAGDIYHYSNNIFHDAVPYQANASGRGYAVRTTGGEMWFQFIMQSDSGGIFRGSLAVNHTSAGYKEAMSVRTDNAFVGIGITNPAYQLDCVGAVHGTSFPASSDVRWKENIAPVENALKSVMEISPVFFDWNDDYLEIHNPIHKRNLGFIAQDVEGHFPEVVSQHERNGVDDYRALDYGRMTAILWAAVQELTAQVRELQAAA